VAEKLAQQRIELTSIRSLRPASQPRTRSLWWPWNGLHDQRFGDGGVVHPAEQVEQARRTLVIALQASPGNSGAKNSSA
jgi:hypothetical protein